MAVIVADGSTGTYTIDNIPQWGSSLEVEVWGRKTTSGSSGVNLRVNGLSTSIYDLQRLYATGATVTADSAQAQAQLGSAGGVSSLALPGSDSTAGVATGGWLRIHGYASSTLDKNVSGIARHPNSTASVGYAISSAGLIETTTPVTSVTVFLISGSFAAGSTITVRVFP